jgi:23S rRNA (pseudouridine1915-N3)-methyltransferase
LIKIIVVGKIKEKFLKDAINEYLKRLSRYTRLSIIEVEDYESSSVEIEQKKEKDQVLKYIDIKDYVVVLDIDGEFIDSNKFSKKLDEWQMTNSNISFIVGGSNGLHQDIKRRANYLLSFSKFTFPHQLFRVMLLEQIYRAYKIINNESYHK